MKRVKATYSPPHSHWVGDGFPVRSLMSYDRMGARNVSPFLLLDYAGPVDFKPGKRPRGVGQHPHKGFETVTLVYQGELEHRDSSGGGGVIGTGDVQWMTAGSGIVHEEFHSQAFTRSGGPLEMVQLWVNLPARHKDAPAAYQTLLDRDIPRVKLGQGQGELRVIAGEYGGRQGPAQTFTPINLWDLKLEPGCATDLRVPHGHNNLIVVLSGTVEINGEEVLRDAGLALFASEGTDIQLEANNTARVLLLTGEPIEEPVVGYGPFVMNSAEEIQEAVNEFRAGQFGMIAPGG
ncbi:pirin family protein [Marinobacter mobilis]|uniref:pirin family protein n=1 Tax=Marinobacter mobilis TaxID=488533 RepID=UPI0035C7807C